MVDEPESVEHVRWSFPEQRPLVMTLVLSCARAGVFDCAGLCQSDAHVGVDTLLPHRIPVDSEHSICLLGKP